MVSFPPCKINIGLDVINKRPDGYHDIATVMYSVPGLCDGLEILPWDAGKEAIEFTSSGALVDCSTNDNIVVKAWSVMNKTYRIGGVKIHLHKSIPFGAGLGGGSADAAFTLRTINKLYGLGLNNAKLADIGSKLGSDVPFFIYDTPKYCTGRGEVMSPANIDLNGYWLVVIKPPVSVSTAEAYAGIVPKSPEIPLMERLAEPIGRWKYTVKNAFEETIFRHHPSLQTIKSSLYEQGALYASMSGSGSALYGLFDKRPHYTAGKEHAVWIMQL